MPPAKCIKQGWDNTAERDLIMNILMASKGPGALKIPWEDVLTQMQSKGYGFTTGAMSQRWSKVILKDFKDFNNSNNSKDVAGSSTPDKAAGGAEKRKASQAAATAAASGDAEDEDEDIEATPSKKAKSIPAKSRASIMAVAQRGRR